MAPWEPLLRIDQEEMKAYIVNDLCRRLDVTFVACGASDGGKKTH